MKNWASRISIILISFDHLIYPPRYYYKTYTDEGRLDDKT